MSVPTRPLPNKPFLVVSGLAGAGKTMALHALEDAGYSCIDNLPSNLLEAFLNEWAAGRVLAPRVALALDSRDPQTPAVVARLEARFRQLGARFLFLEANPQVLLNRFRETRRLHPMGAAFADLSLEQAIARDIQTIEPLRLLADETIDTSTLPANSLKALVTRMFADGEGLGKTFQISVISFGFKYGVPSDLDTIFDVRCFQNPHYEPSLRPLTGLDARVRDFVFADPGIPKFIETVMAYLEHMIPLYQKEGKSYLRIGVGCTGGKHRSVALSEELGHRLNALHPHTRTEHRHHLTETPPSKR